MPGGKKPTVEYAEDVQPNADAHELSDLVRTGR
jgi:hypothetical protein